MALSFQQRAVLRSASDASDEAALLNDIGTDADDVAKIALTVGDEPEAERTTSERAGSRIITRGLLGVYDGLVRQAPKPTAEDLSQTQILARNGNGIVNLDFRDVARGVPATGDRRPARH